MIGVIGGSGLYTLLDESESVPVATPYGDPSAPVAVGVVDGATVAFLPRHGLDHEVPPHRVNYRANLWALQSLGVTTVVAPFAAGSLRPELVPGDVVVVDQLIDRTNGRKSTFFDGPEVRHVSFADPYCPAASAVLLATARDLRLGVHAGGTVVVVEGPRFSSRAESRWHRSMGADLVNMTQQPEAGLARELGLCYSGLGLITDFDAGLDDDPTVPVVTEAEVFRVLAENAGRARALLQQAIPALMDTRPCRCRGINETIEATP